MPYDLRQIALLTAVVLLATAVSTPLFGMLHLPLMVFAIRQFFASVCNQAPERSFWIGNQSIAICVRCFGIYCGVVLGMVARVTRKLALRGLAIGALLNIADVASETYGLHGNLPALRLMLGIMLGAAVGATICAQEKPVVSGQQSV